MNSVFNSFSKEEVDALCGQFRKADTDQDGHIDAAELMTELERQFPGSDSTLVARLRDALLAAGDTNNDGKLDLSEFRQLIFRRQTELFDDAWESSGSQPGSGGGHEAKHSAAEMNQILEYLSQEEIDMLRDTFIRIDGNGDGYIERAELMETVEDVVGPRFPAVAKYLGKLFDVADKDKDNRLDLTEFLDSFACGPGVVPQEVVMRSVASIRVRLSDEEMLALEGAFRRIDLNDDGFIDTDELRVALLQALEARFPDVANTIDSIVANVMASADLDRDGKLNLAEFIRSFQEDQGVLPQDFIDGRAKNVSRRLSPGESVVLKTAFDMLDDAHHDGFLSYSELHDALMESISDQGVLDTDHVRDLVDLIIVTADYDADGKISLRDFIQSFTINEYLMSIPMVAAQERVERATNRLHAALTADDMPKILDVFDTLDKEQGGFFDENELRDTLHDVIAQRLPDIAASPSRMTEVLDAVMSGAETDEDGKYSLDDFIASFVRSGEAAAAAQQQEAHRELPMATVASVTSKMKENMTKEQLAEVMHAFNRLDANGDGYISPEELRAAVTQAVDESSGDAGSVPSDVINDFIAGAVQVTDADGDGRISVKEFIQSFQSGIGVANAMVTHYRGRKGTQVGRMPEELTTPIASAAPSFSGAKPTAPITSPHRQQALPDVDGLSPGLLPQREAGTGADSPVDPLDGTQTMPPRPGGPVAGQLWEQTSPPAAPLNGGELVASADVGTDDAGAIVGGGHSPYSNDVSGVCVTETQLWREFLRFRPVGSGTDPNGYTLDRQTFVNAYLQMENFGLEPTRREVEQLFDKFCGRGASRLTYDQFSVLMLHRSRM